MEQHTHTDRGWKGRGMEGEGEGEGRGKGRGWGKKGNSLGKAVKPIKEREGETLLSGE